MNPVIEKLWNQAATKHSGDSWAEQTAFRKEFAKLVVWETIYTSSHIEGIQGILDHFGIKNK